MKCVLLEGCVVFFKRLRVVQAYCLKTGQAFDGKLAMSQIAAGEEIPCNRGWRCVKQALAKHDKRPPKRHRRH